MFTVLWCYLRNPAFNHDASITTLADLTGQANHLGVTIEADIIKQKLAENNGGYTALGKGYGKTSELVYSKLTTDNRSTSAATSRECYMGARADQQRWRLGRSNRPRRGRPHGGDHKRAGGWG